MGGCRCTYRNCTVRTDGITHLFHYPVFDKYRCHQWLTNAQRLDFLHLKVSQLKNRVVCQYHFLDEMFMNFKKDKLKCFAVPTEDGPFCKPSYETEELDDVLYPINVEQIENELINSNSEKRAKFSVKYGDFLTNCELMELNNAKEEPESKIIDSPKVKRKSQPKPESQQPVFKIRFDNEDEVVDKQYYIEIDQNCAKNTSVETNEKMPDCFQPVSSTPEQITFTYADDSVVKNNTNNIQTKFKVQILSEEPFNQPLPEAPKLIPVPKSYVLHAPDRKNKPKVKVENCNSSSLYNLNPTENSVQSQHYNQNVPFVTQDSDKNESTVHETGVVKSFTQSLPTFEHNNVSTHNTPKGKRLTDERVAAIQEKRKFNKRLRDIITDSLNLLEEPERKETKSQDEIRDSEFPVSQKQLISCFEGRMKRMEDNLREKIDSNRKIMLEMKKQICDMKKATEKCQSSCTKHISPEVHKKYLYQEISKYLTADAKSLIYEELFINEHVVPKKAEPDQTRFSKKRRKH